VTRKKTSLELASGHRQSTCQRSCDCLRLIAGGAIAQLPVRRNRFNRGGGYETLVEDAFDFG